MNLKESFRFTKFLDHLMYSAQNSIQDRNHALTVTKTHLRKLANFEAENKIEIVDTGEFFKNDDVLSFMQYLIAEKETLSIAIGKAKASCGFDIDAAVETNKYRQNLCNAVNLMLRNTVSKRIERGSDYKFNVEGNQTQYFFDVEVQCSEAYDRNLAKSVVKETISKADEVSREIDMAYINTIVDYTTPFDVNDSFEDAMTTYLSM